MKLTFVILLAFLCVANALFPKILQEKFGYLDSPKLKGNRVIGGSEVLDGQRPYQISLRRAQLGIFWSHTCGGSIVAANKVLTAAHCVDGATASSLQVRYGTLRSQTAGPGGDITVSRFAIHANWNTQTIDYDYAVITLNSNIQAGSNAAIISLATVDPAGGTEGIVSGWGYTTGGGSTIPNILYSAEMSVVDRTECDNAWGSNMAVTERMICAIHPSKTACNGDSGGPFTIVVGGSAVLAGVVSWGPTNCPTGNLPMAYATVSAASSWINDQINS